LTVPSTVFLPMNRTARCPGAQQVEGGRRMGRILTILPPFELLRPGTGRVPAKPWFRGSRCELLVRGILSPDHTICTHLCDESEKVALDAEGHIFTQIRVSHQTPAIARLRDRAQQIILFEAK